MIIDCHGHYTTAPVQLGEYRDKQKLELAANADCSHEKGDLRISDDELRHSVEGAQLKLQQERGTDVTIFSPRASWMGHHIGNANTSKYWTEHCNELIYRLTQLYPDNFIGACQLPQIPNGSLDNSIKELERCINEFGFVGCNLNLDPSGGHWDSPPLGDKYWYPFYEKMVELDVPAMIHVSGCCNPAFHATGSYYLSADTTAFMQLMTSSVCQDFPTIKFIIPHGGGAVPFHWGRFRGLADMMKLPSLDELLMNNVFFDTCVYHQPGIDLLVDVIPTKNILFASEMIGAVRGIDPQTGYYFDDTKRYVENNQKLTPQQKQAIFSGNAIHVFSRLQDKLGGK
ncbi:amidohydrolase family protein [Paraglaciecola arctica]|uniref:amidohydrolase family protein n=1 Tax=Paraglaciecola arctica TaxID=1128911 RepID=UPI001C0655EA|nr:amidohydrolase family protein [Paraglaciecola arctica]MBU3002964.1 amidohydrolase [Paraglaciecola arctica]